MADDAPQSAANRIEHALARIEAALGDRNNQHAALAGRHETLRQEMSNAIKALDRILGDGPR